ncbi:MAG: glycerol-3-phosphate 1-O-acyltransferase PlsY [Candidatus Krumholzibacteriia bacterium]
MIRLLLALLVSYLVGAIPWSYLAGRVVGGIDLRTVGSGNLGASNTFRALGARVAIPVLSLDVLQGLVAPRVFARGATDAAVVPAAVAAALAGLAAIVGHMFPVYLGFRGGKGIATSAGVFAALEPQAFLVCLLVFVLAIVLSGGIVSVGSLLSSLALPFAMYTLGPAGGETDWTRLGLAAALVVLVWVKHTANIGRLLHRTEKSLFDRSRGAVR